MKVDFFKAEDFFYAGFTCDQLAARANKVLAERGVPVYSKFDGFWEKDGPHIPHSKQALLIAVEPLQKPKGLFEIKVDGSFPPDEFHIVTSDGKRHVFKFDQPKQKENGHEQK